MKGARKPSKKSVIQAWLERERPAVFGAREAAAVRRHLATPLSDRYLRDVVEACGVEVAAELGGLPRELLPLIHIETLAGAEDALAGLEQRRQSLDPADRAGLQTLQRAGRRKSCSGGPHRPRPSGGTARMGGDRKLVPDLVAESGSLRQLVGTKEEVRRIPVPIRRMIVL